MPSQITSPFTLTMNSQGNFRRGNRWFRLGIKIVKLFTARNIYLIVTVLVFSLLLWAFIWYFAHLVVTNVREAKLGSFEYSFLISDFMQEMPVFKPLENSEKYFYHAISNANTPANIMQYESLAPADEIISYYRLYFEILNYSFMKHSFDSQAMAMFRNTREEFVIYVDKQTHSNKVIIENIKYQKGFDF